MAADQKSRKEYQKKWYAENRKKLSARRKQKYREDAVYRSKILGRVKHVEQRRIPDRTTRVFRTSSGREVRLMTIRRFAQMVGRNVSTINLWHRSSKLPHTPFTTKSRIRYYTEAQAEVVKQEVGGLDRVFRREGLYDRVWQAWQASGVPMWCQEIDCALQAYNPVDKAESIATLSGKGEESDQAENTDVEGGREPVGEGAHLGGV